MTLVSLNGELDEQGKNPNSEIKHVHHHHFVQDWDGNGIHPGGSQTLPNRKSGQLDLLKTMSDKMINELGKGQLISKGLFGSFNSPKKQ